MHFHDAAGHLHEVRDPGRGQLALVHHVDDLLADPHAVAHAVVVLDHVQRDVHAQHAGRLQHQVAHAQLDRHLGQARAQLAVEPLPRIVGHQPLPVIGRGLGLRGQAALGDGLMLRRVAHRPSRPLSALSTAAPPALPVTASRSFVLQAALENAADGFLPQHGIGRLVERAPDVNWNGHVLQVDQFLAFLAGRRIDDARAPPSPARCGRNRWKPARPASRAAAAKRSSGA